MTNASFDFRLQVGLRLAEARGGRKQAGIARAAGISQPLLSAYENGRREPLLHHLVRIASALNVEVSQLIPRSVAAGAPADVMPASVGAPALLNDSTSDVQERDGARSRADGGTVLSPSFRPVAQEKAASAQTLTA